MVDRDGERGGVRGGNNKQGGRGVAPTTPVVHPPFPRIFSMQPGVRSPWWWPGGHRGPGWDVHRSTRVTSVEGTAKTHDGVIIGGGARTRLKTDARRKWGHR